ncbi:SLOG cluster 4 domain-containing protein [Geodermatophilus sp. SYSU D00766]
MIEHKATKPMAIGGSIPILAVFGGSREPGADVLAAAERIGYAIARHHCVVLTGGTGAGTATVRDRALTGAERSTADGGLGAWVGVERSAHVGTPSRDGLRLRLRPGYEHKRNYVEARMCDAAIAFPGEEGTASEVAFSLALGRPVLLLGPKWASDLPLAGPARPAGLKHLQELAWKAVRKKEVTPSPLDPLIEEALDSVAASKDLSPWAHGSLPESDDDASALVDLLLQMLRHRVRGVPAFPEYQDLATAYADSIAAAQRCAGPGRIG